MGPLVETEQDKFAYRAVPLPAGMSLAFGIRQDQFVKDKAFGVVTYAAGFGIHMKPKDFKEICLQVHQENCSSCWKEI